MKAIFFTHHALVKIAERSLDEASIRYALAHPLEIIPDAQHSERQVVHAIMRHDGGKAQLLRVVVEETPLEIIVLTVYLTSKINKYRSSKGDDDETRL
jgi:undecaprenyl pyrophosphate synthase